MLNGQKPEAQLDLACTPLLGAMQEQQTEKAGGALHSLTSFIHVAASMGYPGQRGLGDSGEPSGSQGWEI